jgi:hypothetical protein
VQGTWHDARIRPRIRFNYDLGNYFAWFAYAKLPLECEGVELDDLNPLARRFGTKEAALEFHAGLVSGEEPIEVNQDGANWWET